MGFDATSTIETDLACQAKKQASKEAERGDEFRLVPLKDQADKNRVSLQFTVARHSLL
jgi:hypothetical protein